MRGTRFVAIVLPDLQIELAEAREADGTGHVSRDADKDARASAIQGPLAVVIAVPGGAVQTELDLLGNTRLDEVSKEARARRIYPGETIASARAKDSSLRVRVVPLHAVKTTLERLAEAALAFGSTSSLSIEKEAVWIDTTGCAHLHANEEDPSGERNLLRKLGQCVRTLGHACRIAIADAPQIAAMVARFGQRRQPKNDSRAADFFVVPEGFGKQAIAQLPTLALPLDEETVQWLRDIGVGTIGEMQQLPSRALALRLGDRARPIQLLIAGEDQTPLDPYRPPEHPEETIELDYGIESNEALLFVAKTLCDRMSVRLVGRGVHVTQLHIVLKLDRALIDSNAAACDACEGFERALGEPRVRLSMPLAGGLWKSKDLFALLRTKLESFELPAPVLGVSLVAVKTIPISWRSLNLFIPEAKAEAALPKLVAELLLELGENGIGRLELGNSWLPEKRSILVPYNSPSYWAGHRGAGSPPSGEPTRESQAVEPSRMVSSPWPIAIDETDKPKLLSKIEAVEWWRYGLEGRSLISMWIAPMGALAFGEFSVERANTRRMISQTSQKPSKKELLIQGWID